MTQENDLEYLKKIGDALSAIGLTYTKASHSQGVGSLVGLGLSAAGSYLSGSSAATLQQYEGQSARYIAGSIASQYLYSYVGGELGFALGSFIARGLLVAAFDAVVLTNPFLAAAYLLAITLTVLGPTFVGGFFGGAYGTHWWAWLDNVLNPVKHDPLTLDLDGDGIELISLANSTTHFDLDGNGFAERTGWVSSDDGMLVRDGNRNGNVDSVAELFGSATQDGFAVLETFDDNHDGRIDAADAVFLDLKVWRDLNQNGVSEVGELFTLTQLGIQSISGQELRLAA